MNMFEAIKINMFMMSRTITLSRIERDLKVLWHQVVELLGVISIIISINLCVCVCGKFLSCIIKKTVRVTELVFCGIVPIKL